MVGAWADIEVNFHVGADFEEVGDFKADFDIEADFEAAS